MFFNKVKDILNLSMLILIIERLMIIKAINYNQLDTYVTIFQ